MPIEAGAVKAVNGHVLAILARSWVFRIDIERDALVCEGPSGIAHLLLHKSDFLLVRCEKVMAS